MRGKGIGQRLSDGITVGFLFALLLTIFGSPFLTNLIWLALVAAGVFVTPSVVAGLVSAAEWGMERVGDRSRIRREGPVASSAEGNAVVPVAAPQGRGDEVSPGA